MEYSVEVYQSSSIVYHYTTTVVPNIFKLFDDADLNQPSSNKPQK